MAETTTITITVPVELKAKLDRLAELMERDQSEILAAALDTYADYELPIVEGILRGMEDVKAGRVVPHDEAMDRLDAIVEAAIERQKQRRSA
jgi:predicted transcriptional regulator